MGVNNKRKKRSTDASQSSVDALGLIGGANYPQYNKEPSRIDGEMKTIALPKTLKHLMSDKGISLRKLAKQTGISQSTISGYLSGSRRTYDPQHLGTLADFFSVSVDYLLFQKQIKTNLNNLPAKKLFSKVVRLTIEDFEELNDGEEEK
ncbi:MAG: hypothetical protein A4S09_14135 [Proteobacteria bacterium SG_bin7]|nr:MAG: hypothetical protein A4S09_14135 [Proteobacteria bacterium SG_bin7]